MKIESSSLNAKRTIGHTKETGRSKMEDPTGRKLRGVYDAIDEGNYKKAVKLCGKKDIAGWDVTKALLAFCYTKTKQEDQALMLARQIVLHNPVHPSILVPLRYTFKALRLEEDLIRMYEGALQVDPTNLEHAHELFGCYVRMGQAKQMQMLAQGLFRATSNAEYVFWAVTSMLHADTVPPMVLMLAEKMIHKAIYDTEEDATKRYGKLIQPGAEELHLYVDILCRQDKWETALTALDDLRARVPVTGSVGIEDEEEFEGNPSAVKMFEFQAQELRKDILFKLGRREEAEKQLLSILDIFPDQWDAFSRLIDSTILGADGESLGTDALSRAVVELRSLIHVRAIAHPHLRAPKLAEVVLLQRYGEATGRNGLPVGWEVSESEAVDATGVAPLHVPNDTNPYLAEVSQKIAQYVVVFGHKACCFSDVKPLLESVHASGTASMGCLEAFRFWCLARAEVLQKQLKKQCEDDRVADAPRTEALPNRNSYMTLICSICKAHQLAVFAETLLLDLGSEVETNMDRYQNLMDLFILCLPLGAHGIGGDREVQPCDELMLLLSAHHRRAASTGELDEYLLWAIMLQSAMNLSEHNYSFPLEALDPLRALGAASASLGAFSKLGVKHVQECGQFDMAQTRLKAVLKFHTSADRDTADMIAHSFKYHNYMKSLELLEFSRKCQRSLTLAVACVESPLLELTDSDKLDNLEELDLYLAKYIGATSKLPTARRPSTTEEDIAELSDNSDYGLLVRCDELSTGLNAASLGRKEDSSWRIKVGAAVLDLAHAFVQGEAASARKAFESVMDCEDARLVLCSQRGMDKLFTDGRAGRQWCQQIQQNDNKGQASIVKAFKEVTQAILDAWGNGTGYTGTFTALKEVQDCLGDASSIHASSQSLSLVSPMNPQWLRDVSFFVRLIATFVPIFLRCCARNSEALKSISAGKAKKGKKKGGDKTNDTGALNPADATLVRLASELGGVIDTVQSLLAEETKLLVPGDGGLAPSDAYVPYVKDLVNGLDYKLPDFPPESDAAPGKTNITASLYVAQELANSHYASCKALSEVLKRKRNSLQHLEHLHTKSEAKKT